MENTNFATWTSVETWFDLSAVKVIPRPNCKCLTFIGKREVGLPLKGILLIYKVWIFCYGKKLPARIRLCLEKNVPKQKNGHPYGGYIDADPPSAVLQISAQKMRFGQICDERTGKILHEIIFQYAWGVGSYKNIFQ